MTKVIFRKWKASGDVIALFPEVPADIYGGLCLSYEHVSQHGGASTHAVYVQTTLATPVESAELRRELEEVGYDDLQRVTRITYQMYQKRLTTAARIRG